MNKIIKTIFSLGAITLLSGCGANKVSETKFKSACDKLEDHQYYQVSIKYDISVKYTDNGSEDNTNESNTLQYAFRYVYIEENDEWAWCWCRNFVWENEDEEVPYESEFLHLIFSVKNERPFVSTTASYNGIKVSTTYYTGPLKISTKIKGTTSGDNFTRKANNSYHFEFDKYGFTTKYTENIDESFDGKTVVGGTNIYRNQVRKGTKKVTITYSDVPVEE